MGNESALANSCIMRLDGVKVVSMNGLSSPVKRAKFKAKFRKEKMQVLFLQETHLSTEEHEKLKRFYHKQSNRRGVAILITNSTKFEP